jgi:hypothetical protein
MTTQPEALALADILDRSVLQAHADAAAELRRLHEVNQELLTALKSIAECCDEDRAARDYLSRQTEIRGIARAAIAKAEGEMK